LTSGLNTMDERQLIERCIAGDNAGWRCFLDRYGNLVYGAIVTLLARFSISEPSVAEDIFESVIEKLLADDRAALRQFRGNSKFTTYLVAIARNKTHDHIRALRRRPTVSISSPIGGSKDGEEDELEKVLASDLDLGRQIEARLTLEEVLEDLTAPDQLILKMYYIEGLQDGEIAEVMNMSVDAISARKSRALKKLRALVEDGRR
jgi:RNA polymerase sigma-70 factor (ECF subfamily)